MSELNGKPYAFEWESNQRDQRGSRIVKFRVCYPHKTVNRWSPRIFKTEIAAAEFIEREQSRIFFEVETSDPGESKCNECGCSYGVHLVTCYQFQCSLCGQNGPACDHFGGCPCSTNPFVSENGPLGVGA